VGGRSVLENELKVIFKWRFTGLPDNKQKDNLIWSVHTWKGLKNLTQTYFQFDVASVADFRVVDELRCIANSVKHTQGRVNKELNLLTRWPHNKPIDVANVDLTRLREACVSFFSDFAQKAERAINEKFGNPAKARK